MEELILVDKDNKILGYEEKLKTHQDAKLHRAFSILIFNSKGELLIQQRNKQKYHSGGLWANSVCSHPRKGESYLVATQRRLKQELGIETKLKRVFAFIYKAEFKDLTEYEHDTVFFGKYDGEIFPDKEEIMAYKWISLKSLNSDLIKSPEKYAEWFKIIIHTLGSE